MPSLAIYDVNRIAVKQHACPRCAGAMMLVDVGPARIGFEMRTFEGIDCRHIDRIIVASDAAKWLAGGLRPPV